MTCCNPDRAFTHYTGETKIYYLDLGEWIKGRTVTSITSVTADDSALVFASTAILTADTSDYDQEGNAVTIEANTGIKWTMSGGTAGVEIDDYTATITATIVTAAGTEICPIRVRVLA